MRTAEVTNATKSPTPQLIIFPRVILKRQKLSKKQKAIHDEFQKYGKNAKQWMRKCILMLPKIVQERIWEKKNFGSIYEYAAKIAGMSQSKVDEALWVLRKIEDKPELMKVVEKRGVHSVKPIANVATKETSTFWADKAMKMSQNTLRTYARDFKTESPGSQNSDAQDSWVNPGINAENDLNKPILFEKIATSLPLDPDVIEELEKLKGKQNWNAFMREMIELKKQKEKQIQEEMEKQKPEPVKTKSRNMPRKMRRYVVKRAKSICEENGCTKAGVHIHHIEPFAISKEHNPDKLKLLCKDHHDIVHSSTEGVLEGLINANFLKHKWAGV